MIPVASHRLPPSSPTSAPRLQPRLGRLLLWGLALLCLPLSAATLESVICGFTKVHTQTGTAQPSATAQPYEFYTLATASDGPVFQSGSVTAPDGFPFTLGTQGNFIGYRKLMADAIDFDNDFPDGNYTVSLVPVGGGKAVSSVFKLPNKSFPIAPYIKNAGTLDGMDPGFDLTIAWTSWSGGTASDRIVLKIQPSTSGNGLGFETKLGTSRQLDGNATSVVLPAGTLRLGVSYDLSLSFLKAPTFLPGDAIPGHPTAEKLAYVQSTTWRVFQTAATSKLVAFVWSGQSRHATHWESNASSIDLVPDVVAPKAVLRVTYPSQGPLATVTFNGPSGSGLNQTPGTRPELVNGWIESQEVVLDSGTPPGGFYSARINGKTYNESANPAPSFLAAWVPRLSLETGGTNLVRSLRWAFRRMPGDQIPFPLNELQSLNVDFLDSAQQVLARYRVENKQTTVIDTSDDGLVLSQIDQIRFTYRLINGTQHTAVLPRPATLPDPAVNFFAGSERAKSPSTNWIINPWYGWCYDQGFPWVYSLAHGYVYLANGNHAEGYYVVDQNLGWFYFTEASYRAGWMYRYDAPGGWLMYLKGTTQPLRWFYSANTDSWVREDRL